ncbi:hypothetical protein SAMN05444673_2169 [Bacillus sp. OV166]|nr:hypothetical protein SAMN05444673_2169 [Bacillus sp. OV166]
MGGNKQFRRTAYLDFFYSRNNFFDQQIYSIVFSLFLDYFLFARKLFGM